MGVWWNTNEKKDLGRHCSRDSSCKSGHCHYWKCVECTSDKDCGDTDDKGVGITGPGNLHSAFCVRNKCSRFRTGKEIPAEGYPIPTGHDSVDYIPRHHQKESLAHSTMYTLPITHDHPAAIKINATAGKSGTVKISSGKLPTAGYSSVIGRNGVVLAEDSGITNIRLFDNPKSILTTQPRVVFIEKRHTLDHKKEGWDTQRGDLLLKKRNEALKGCGARNDNTALLDVSADHTKSTEEFGGLFRSKSTKMCAADVAHCNRESRDLHLVRAAAVSKYQDRLIESALDAVHLRKTRMYCKDDTSHPNSVKQKLGSPSWKNHVNKARKEFEARAKKESQRSSLHCTHIEDQPGVTYDRKSETATFPLDKELVFLAGDISTFPMSSFGTRGGVIVFHYNEAKKELEIFVAASQHTHINFESDTINMDSNTTIQSAMQVGPVGATAVSASPEGYGSAGASHKEASARYDPDEVDGRNQKFYVTTGMPKGLYEFATQLALGSGVYHFKMLDKLDPDFSRYEVKDPTKICDEAKINRIRPYLQKGFSESENPRFKKVNDAETFVSNAWSVISSPWRWVKDTDKAYGKGMSKLHSLKLIVDCSYDYLKNDVGVTAYDWLELTAFGHMVAELPTKEVLKFVEIKTWDDEVKLAPSLARTHQPVCPQEGRRIR